jgi:ATP-binding cassette subfamily C protein
MKKQYNLIQNNFYVMRGVWKYDKSILLLIAANTLVMAISPLISILFPRQIINELLGAKRVDKLILLLLGFFVAASVVGYITHYLKGIFMMRPVKVVTPYINEMYKKCMETSFQCTEDQDFLNNVQTATRGSGRGNYDGMSGMLHKWFNFLGPIIALCGYITIISTLNIFILLYLIFNITVNYFLAIAQKKYEHNKRNEITKNERRSDYLYNVMYDFSFGKEIRLYGISDWIGSKFMFFRIKIHDIESQIKDFNTLTVWLDILLSFIREGFVYAYLCYMVINNNMSIADFTMYVATIAGFRGLFETIVTNFADMHGLSMQINDYRIFMSRPDVMVKTENPVPIPLPPYSFEFRNVSFKYHKSENYIFNNLNLTIPKEQKLALVGHNGAGKSTLIKLLLRLYDVTEGEILCNGIDIKKFDRDEYYGVFSAVFQEVLPLAFSVADNIGVNDVGRIDKHRVDLCIQQIGLWDKINSLKYGADTCVQKIIDDEGIEFSGGEKQKLMIARALYKSGGVMVLDEPTAALDVLTERDIYEKFNNLTQNKTTIYVSHRLASTRFCDVIAMFDHGELVEYGTHEALIALNGKYADMFNIQAKYYKEESNCEKVEPF